MTSQSQLPSFFLPFLFIYEVWGGHDWWDAPKMLSRAASLAFFSDRLSSCLRFASYLALGRSLLAWCFCQRIAEGFLSGFAIPSRPPSLCPRILAAGAFLAGGCQASGLGICLSRPAVPAAPLFSPDRSW